MGQGLARITKKRRAGVLEQPERDHGAGARGPVDGQGAAPGGAADAVGIAARKDQRIAHDILAPDVDADNGEWHANAAFGHAPGLIDGDAFAAQDAVQIADGGMQHFDLWIGRQPGDDVFVCDLIGTHACALPFLYDIASD